MFVLYICSWLLPACDGWHHDSGNSINLFGLISSISYNQYMITSFNGLAQGKSNGKSLWVKIIEQAPMHAISALWPRLENDKWIGGETSGYKLWQTLAQFAGVNILRKAGSLAPTYFHQN